MYGRRVPVGMELDKYDQQQQAFGAMKGDGTRHQRGPLRPARAPDEHHQAGSSAASTSSSADSSYQSTHIATSTGFGKLLSLIIATYGAGTKIKHTTSYTAGTLWANRPNKTDFKCAKLVLQGCLQYSKQVFEHSWTEEVKIAWEAYEEAVTFLILIADAAEIRKEIFELELLMLEILATQLQYDAAKRCYDNTLLLEKMVTVQRQYAKTKNSFTSSPDATNPTTELHRQMKHELAKLLFLCDAQPRTLLDAEWLEEKVTPFVKLPTFNLDRLPPILTNRILDLGGIPLELRRGKDALAMLDQLPMEQYLQIAFTIVKNSFDYEKCKENIGTYYDRRQLERPKEALFELFLKGCYGGKKKRKTEGTTQVEPSSANGKNKNSKSKSSSSSSRRTNEKENNKNEQTEQDLIFELNDLFRMLEYPLKAQLTKLTTGYYQALAILEVNPFPSESTCFEDARELQGKLELITSKPIVESDPRALELLFILCSREGRIFDFKLLFWELYYKRKMIEVKAEDGDINFNAEQHDKDKELLAAVAEGGGEDDLVEKSIQLSELQDAHHVGDVSKNHPGQQDDDDHEPLEAKLLCNKNNKSDGDSTTHESGQQSGDQTRKGKNLSSASSFDEDGTENASSSTSTTRRNARENDKSEQEIGRERVNKKPASFWLKTPLQYGLQCVQNFLKLAEQQNLYLLKNPPSSPALDRSLSPTTTPSKKLDLSKTKRGGTTATNTDHPNASTPASPTGSTTSKASSATKSATGSSKSGNKSKAATSAKAAKAKPKAKTGAKINQSSKNAASATSTVAVTGTASTFLVLSKNAAGAVKKLKNNVGITTKTEKIYHAEVVESGSGIGSSSTTGTRGQQEQLFRDQFVKPLTKIQKTRILYSESSIEENRLVARDFLRFLFAYQAFETASPEAGDPDHEVVDQDGTQEGLNKEQTDAKKKPTTATPLVDMSALQNATESQELTQLQISNMQARLHERQQYLMDLYSSENKNLLS
ncbi:unnamed protein product [Amoebophrya sp. A120]|nr:unnamed protein product [Amoebophrya sp. A120]|eukprot:GSA120T00010081001.1